LIHINRDREIPVDGRDLEGFLPAQNLLDEFIESAFLYFKEKRLSQQANNFSSDKFLHRFEVSYFYINFMMVSKNMPLELMSRTHLSGADLASILALNLQVLPWFVSFV
jgi:hypothetical protein